VDEDVEERGMVAGCGAPTLEKATVAGEGELRARGVVNAPAVVACVCGKRKYCCLFEKP
jgi:hypothetical protein